MTHRRSCAFILSHGRPDNVITAQTLIDGGYRGDWFVVIDDEDASGAQYVEQFGAERVILFDKRAVGATFDTADLSDDYRSVVFARNVAFDLARERGYTHFVEMDDDYAQFAIRYQDDRRLRALPIRDLDAVFDAMFDWLDDSQASAVAFAQGGDLLGGAGGREWRLRRVKRKVMNAIFCRTDADWRFIGRVNEDVNTYTTLGTRGHLFMSTMNISLYQAPTQSQAGGMTDLYLREGTYWKSFFPVMMTPSAVRINAMRSTHGRIHHRVTWGKCVPMIVPETTRKPMVELTTQDT